MQSVSIYSYFYFGTCVRYLESISEGTSIKDKYYVLDNIKILLKQLDSLGLVITKNIRSTSKLIALADEFEKLPLDSKLTSEQTSALKDIMNRIRETLDSELEQRIAFTIMEKRYDTNKLLNNIGLLMSPGIFEHLDQITKYDITESGKCIAFDLPTSAAFHLLRSTEAELRLFYCSLVRTKRVQPLMWGNMVSDLRKRPRTKSHTTLYNNLDNIRLSYRNPTQHPDTIYTIDEAQDLMPLCFEAISRMVHILNPSK